MVRADVRARLREARRGLLIAGVLCLLLVAVVVAVADPFASGHGSSGSIDNGAPTGLATVQRRSLTAQQTLVGTVGYAGAWTVAVPGGTSSTDLTQAKQQAASSQAAFTTASATLSADSQAFAGAAAAAQAAHLKEVSDCAGTNAAVAASATSPNSSSSPPASADTTSGCSSSIQAAETSQAAADAARQKVAADQAQTASARTTLASAEASLNAARSASSSYGPTATFTALPTVGDVVRRGEPLYAINGAATLLLYGNTAAWRSLAVGMTPGRDVAELNANLRALGYGALGGDRFTAGTEQAVSALQQAHGLPPTGSFALGSVVFEPSAARIVSVTPTTGQSVQTGPIITLSSTRHSVSIQLNAAEQSQVKVGDRVLITLPDNSTTPGIVDYVGKVATTSGGQNANGNGGTSAPALPVTVRFTHPGAAGSLDQAPVNVLITTASIRNALVVPVNALVALAGGGYAVEVVTSRGAHQLVAVKPGLFDDQDGLVQVKGAGVVAGQRVVVPASS